MQFTPKSVAEAAGCVLLCAVAREVMLMYYGEGKGKTRGDQDSRLRRGARASVTGVREVLRFLCDGERNALLRIAISRAAAVPGHWAQSRTRTGTPSTTTTPFASADTQPLEGADASASHTVDDSVNQSS